MIKYFHPLLMLLLIWHCHHDEAATSLDNKAETATFSQEFALQEGEQVQLGDKNAPDRLHLTLLSLNDSRCPANANCVHYGSATASLSIRDTQGNNQIIALCIGSCSSGPIRDTHTVTTQVQNLPYKITLKQVQPFPGLERPGEVKEAVLLVER